MSLCGRGLPSFPHSCFLLARPWVDEVCWEGWCSLDDGTFLPSTETERRTQPEVSSHWKPGKAAAEVALLYSSVLLLGPVLYLPEILSSPHQASTATSKKLGILRFHSGQTCLEYMLTPRDWGQCWLWSAGDLPCVPT